MASNKGRITLLWGLEILERAFFGAKIAINSILGFMSQFRSTVTVLVHHSKQTKHGSIDHSDVLVMPQSTRFFFLMTNFEQDRLSIYFLISQQYLFALLVLAPYTPQKNNKNESTSTKWNAITHNRANSFIYDSRIHFTLCFFLFLR